MAYHPWSRSIEVVKVKTTSTSIINCVTRQGYVHLYSLVRYHVSPIDHLWFSPGCLLSGLLFSNYLCLFVLVVSYVYIFFFDPSVICYLSFLKVGT